MKDRLSALMDGDLAADETRPVLDSLKRAPELRDWWDTYCLIGDVLRGEDTGGPDLTARVMTDIRQEPELLVPVAPRHSESNDKHRKAGWHARLMPLAASVMGVAAVGYVAYTLYPQVESTPAPSAVASSEQNRNAVTRLPAAGAGQEPHREYVFVHQAVSGGGPLPGGVQYARTVSDLRGDVSP